MGERIKDQMDKRHEGISKGVAVCSFKIGIMGDKMLVYGCLWFEGSY